MPGRGGRGGPFGNSTTLSTGQRRILDYAIRNSGSARIKLAVEGGAQTTSAFILGSDAVVIGMGGFSGSDNAPSIGQLGSWTTAGRLRFVLGNGEAGNAGFPAMMGGAADSATAQRSSWIRTNCAEIPADSYGGDPGADATGGFLRATTLYDCAPKV